MAGPRRKPTGPAADEERDFELEEIPPDHTDEALEEALANCSGSFTGAGGVFMCGASGSEDCDLCPFNRDIGKTRREIDELAAYSYEEVDPEDDAESELDFN
jgi:hypothetical protein